MAGLRLILGAVGQSQARGLLIGPGQPELRLTGGGRTVGVEPVECDRLRVRDVLQSHGLRLWSFTADGLLAAREYDLAASIPGRPEWTTATFKTLARPEDSDDLCIAAMSCYYDGYRTDADLLATLKQWAKDIDFKILLGDNLYLDVPGDSTFESRPYDHTVDRYVRYFWASGYSDVLSYRPTLVTWDDHEFWNNYPEEIDWLTRTRDEHREAYRQASLDCLDSFQTPLNPAGVGHRSFAFHEAPCVSFFFADIRTDRPRLDTTGQKRFMPEDALSSLRSWACALTRPGVLVIGQPLWIERGGRTDYTPPNYSFDFYRVWECLADAPYDVMILTGDVHFSRILQIHVRSRQHGLQPRPVYEVVTSPACHIPTTLSSILHSDWWQGRGLVEAPASLPEAAIGRLLKPRITQYYLGSACPTTFAVLRFKRLDEDRVRVGVRLLDTHQKREPYLEDLREGSGVRKWETDRSRSHVEMFVLKRRGTS